jgi:hypothetical protein
VGTFYALDIRRDVTVSPPVWVAAVLDVQQRRLYESASLIAAESARRAEVWARRHRASARKCPVTASRV